MDNLGALGADPYLVVLGLEQCWRCDRLSQVVTYGMIIPFEDDIKDSYAYFYQYISELSEQSLLILRERQPNYRLHKSSGHDTPYYTNFCECGANFGDFYLHESCHAFDPLGERSITMWHAPTSNQGYIHNDLVGAQGVAIINAVFASPLAWDAQI